MRLMSAQSRPAHVKGNTNMSDPAIEAVDRANVGVEGYWNTTRDAMEEAAHEALRPIQKLWRRELGADNGLTLNERARKIFDGLAPLIFNDDEMEGGVGE